MLDNGNCVSFVDGVLQESFDKIPVGDVLVDGSIVGDINEVVLKDRELLSESGALICVVNIDSNRRIIVDGPKLISRGFVTQNSFNEIYEELEDLVYNIVMYEIKLLEIDWNYLKNKIKENISDSIFKSTGKTPVVIPVIIDMCEEEE